jgi:putative membrane protein
MDSYLIYKSLHIIGLVMWIGGIFSILAIIKYQNNQNDEQRVSLAGFGTRIYFASNLIGLVITISCGLLMLMANTALAKGGWFHAKMLFVIVLLVVDHIIFRKMKQIAKKKQSVAFGMFHGIAGLAFICGVLLAVLKPF